MSDKYAKNEAMDRAHIVCEMWQRHIVEQAAVKDSPELSAKADEIARDLGEFYQMAGRMAFGGDVE